MPVYSPRSIYKNIACSVAATEQIFVLPVFNSYTSSRFVDF